MSAPGFVRKAQADDKLEVLSMTRDVYGGLDYLRDYYDYFLAADNITGFVYVIQNEIVGFVAECIVDDGQTVVDRAGRVKVEFQGQGIYTRLFSEIREKFLPSTVTRVSIGISSPGNKSALKDEDVVIRRAQAHFHPVMSVFCQKISMDSNTVKDSCILLTEDQLSKLLEDRRKVDYLFPDQRLLLDWVPYRVRVPSNIPLMFGKNTVFFMDVQCSESKEKVSGLLSAGTYLKTESFGYSYILEIFSTKVESLVTHIVAHFSRLLQSERELQTISLVVNPGFDMHFLEKVMSSFGCKIDKELTSTYFKLRQYETDLYPS